MISDLLDVSDPFVFETRCRKSDKSDRSLAHMNDRIGTYMCDIDFMGYDYVDGEPEPFVILEQKHPRAFDDDAQYAISFERGLAQCSSSLRAVRNTARRLQVPLFGVVNWTKGKEDPDLHYRTPDPTLFMVPLNLRAYDGFRKWHQKARKSEWEWHDEERLYVSPREYANLINSLKPQPGFIGGKWVELPTKKRFYPLATERIDWDGIYRGIEAGV